MKKDHIIF